MTQDPDAIDPHNNRESRAAEESASPASSRASGGGAVFSGALPPDVLPGTPAAQDGDPESGTSAGNPLDGVLIDPADAEQAVPGDEGPEHPGQR